MTFDAILYRKSGAIAEIRFNRPHRLNAVIEALYDELLRALDDAENDNAVRVIIVTGEGRAFCAGADMKQHSENVRTSDQRRAYLQREQDVCHRIYTLKKPVIAAVNGYALGAGAEMAVACDFILMAQSARLGFPELSIGAFVGGGVSYILPQLIGLAKAREMIFFGEQIDGEEAAAIGLAQQVYADDTFIQDVYEFAGQLAEKAPISMRLAKARLNHAGQDDLDSALQEELEDMMHCSSTQDWQEGVDAFTQKRKPVFKGK